MQKLLRRSALVKRQVARRTAEKEKKTRRLDKTRYLRESANYNEVLSQDIKAERIARREDWLLGPLAPKRDAGQSKDTYGAIDISRLRAVEKPIGKYEFHGIVEGDRVVIIEDGHMDQGKIGKVTEVRDKAEECTIEGLNIADVNIPSYMLMQEVDKVPVRPYPKPLPLSSVRLVAPIHDPSTGTFRDFIINKLQFRRSPKAEEMGRPPRFVDGVEPAQKIPYPETEPEKFQDHDCDTLRIEVEQKTWIPTLLRPPMPPGIINELRSKYSKFRDRHDDAYIEQKKREDKEATERKQSIQKMMTPLQELHTKEKAEKRAKGKPVLTHEMLAKIGEVMAKNGANRLQSTQQEAPF